MSSIAGQPTPLPPAPATKPSKAPADDAPKEQTRAASAKPTSKPEAAEQAQQGSKSLLGRAWSGITAPIGQAIDGVKNVGKRVMGGIRNGASMLVGTIDDATGGMIDKGKRIFSRWYHDKIPPQDPKIRDHQPDVPAVKEKKPTGAELRAAELKDKPTKADMAAAERFADEAFKRLDLSKRDLVLWVPGTGSHKVEDNVRDAIVGQFGDRASWTHLDYPASVDFGPSSSTGMEAFRLLLAKIADAGGDHRVLVSGHSQGAWVIGDAMRDPKIHAAVDRAVIYGNPGPSKSNYTDRKDGKVIELNDPNDPITWPMDERDAFLRGLEKWNKGDKVAASFDLVKTLSPKNAGVAMYYLARWADRGPWDQADPHHYEDQFPDGFKWMDLGTLDAPRRQGIFRRTPSEIAGSLGTLAAPERVGATTDTPATLEPAAGF